MFQEKQLSIKKIFEQLSKSIIKAFYLLLGGISMYSIFVLGTAGSGKTTLVASFLDWLRNKNLYTISINLDPGVINLPYTPEVDIRDYITIEQLMEKYNLGPNGALIMAADLISTKLKEIINEIEDYDADYLLFDTPGQLELFAFRTAGPYIVKRINRIKDNRTLILYLVDSSLCYLPSSLVSVLLLGQAIHYRFLIPQIDVLSKIDILPQNDFEKFVSWTDEPETLKDAINEELSGIDRIIALKVADILVEHGSISSLLPVSGLKGTGLENLYAMVQRVFAGGEDYRTE